MTKSRRLKPLAGLAKDQEDKAAALLGDSRRRHQGQRQRLEELERFQQEYQRRFDELGSAGAGSLRLHEYRRFMSQLGDAVAQQRRVVEDSARALEQLEQEWSKRRSRRQALDKAIERFEAQEGRAANRREQRESDDKRVPDGPGMEEHR